MWVGYVLLDMLFVSIRVIGPRFSTETRWGTSWRVWQPAKTGAWAPEDSQVYLLEK